MQTRPKGLVNLGIGVTGTIPVILGWSADSSPRARILFATLMDTASAALFALTAFGRVYPIGLVAVAALLTGLASPPTTPSVMGILIAALVAAGVVIHSRTG